MVGISGEKSIKFRLVLWIYNNVFMKLHTLSDVFSGS